MVEGRRGHDGSTKVGRSGRSLSPRQRCHIATRLKELGYPGAKRGFIHRNQYAHCHRWLPRPSLGWWARAEELRARLRPATALSPVIPCGARIPATRPSNWCGEKVDDDLPAGANITF